MEPRPASAAEAVARARQLLGSPGNQANGYLLGGGDYRPMMVSGRLVDVPWTNNGVASGCDCSGFAMSWCYKLPRHRAGFNRGAWATVADDVNPNSGIEDSVHGQDLFRRVVAPEPGDLVCYPTFRLHGYPQPWIGHVAIVVGVDRASSWDIAAPQWHLLDVIQVRGPNGRRPAAIATDGSVFDQHDATWPHPMHLVGVEGEASVKTVMLRVIP